jgi:hypothetical protein
MDRTGDSTSTSGIAARAGSALGGLAGSEYSASRRLSLLVFLSLGLSGWGGYEFTGQ